LIPNNRRSDFNPYAKKRDMIFNAGCFL